MPRFIRYKRGQRAQTTSEYIIIVVIVAVASIAVILLFGNQIRSLFGASTKTMSGQENVQAEDFSSGVDEAVDKDFNSAFETDTGGGGETE